MDGVRGDLSVEEVGELLDRFLSGRRGALSPGCQVGRTVRTHRDGSWKRSVGVVE